MTRIGEDGYVYKESGNFYTRATVDKYDLDQVEYVRRETGLLVPQGHHFKELGITPYEVTDGGQPGNVLTNVGIQQLQQRLVAAEQVWTTSNGALGVGTSTTAAAATDTNLLGGSKYFQVWGVQPAAASQVMTFVSTFGTSVANFAWEEWGVVIPDTATTYTSGTTLQTNYVLLNRKVVNLGTKTSAQSWTLTVTITIA
jgi:hypothetical protein